MKQINIKQIIPTNLRLYRNDDEEKISELILGFALVRVEDLNERNISDSVTERIVPFTNTSILTESESFWDATFLDHMDMCSISVTEIPLHEVVHVLGNNKHYYKDKNESEDK